MSIGYACVQIGKEKTKMSAIRLKNATEENLRGAIASNLDALEQIIRYNIENDIKLFRISSDIIPLGSHPANQFNWRAEFNDRLNFIGELIRHAGIRVSMHPGQYTVLNSPDEDVAQRAAADLLYHCEVLDALGCDTACKIVLHIGGVYSDKREAMDRFMRNYSLLDNKIKTRLVVENDDRAYNVEDVLYVSGQTGMPVVFDYLHHELNRPKSDLSPFDWINECRNTWENKDGRQKIHYSQSDTNFAAGAHSKHIRAQEFMRFYNGLRHKDVDLMLEVKDKNLSAVKCILLTKSGLRTAELEREWARYKYLILSRSASIYNKIRSVLKDKSHPDAALFYGLIDEALYLPEDKGAEVNAAQHVWGYISKESSGKEAERFFSLLSQYQRGEKQRDAIKNFLYRAAKRQNITYLLEPLYFYL